MLGMLPKRSCCKSPEWVAAAARARPSTVRSRVIGWWTIAAGRRRTDVLRHSVGTKPSWQQARGSKRVKVKGFPGDYRVKLFRVEVSTHRTEWVVTNDLSQDTTQGAQEVSAVRWKIEEIHREAKQLTGLEDCQCRKARIQRT